MIAARGILLGACLMALAAPVLAADAAEEPAWACQSCTARHKALQNLQAARTNPKPDSSADHAVTETKESDSAKIALPPPSPTQSD